MRKVLAILLVFVLLLPVLGKLAVWGHYMANMRYYSEVLCENQSRPELNCDGHCVLAQRLDATQPQAPEAPALQWSQFELSVFVAHEAAPWQQFLPASEPLNHAFAWAVALPPAALILVSVPPPELIG